MLHTAPLTRQGPYARDCHKPVVTRFAPSPTGYLHIGGARTALFSWAYARHTGGKFLLRIEDTDRERSTEGAVQAIYDGLSWLGLNWDGEPTLQFSRAPRHAEIAASCWPRPGLLLLLLAGGAGHDARGRARRRPAAALQRHVARPRPGRSAGRRVTGHSHQSSADGEIIVHDHVQGEVVFKTENLDDFIILRSDGTPTYMLAVVVDDHDMGVTHIIRGDDHLTNAARQIVIYNGMDWEVPEMAHIPLIHGPDGAKLSKRHGALGVDAYRRLGYLPEAHANYLARLGWSHGDSEFFSSRWWTGSASMP